MKRKLFKTRKFAIGMLAISLLLFSSCEDKDLEISFEVSKNTEILTQNIPIVAGVSGSISGITFQVDVASAFAKYDDDAFKLSEPRINFLQYEVKNLPSDVTSFTLDVTIFNGVVPIGTFQITESSTGKTTISELDLSTINANLTTQPINLSTTVNISNVVLANGTTDSNFDFVLYADLTVKSINVL